MSSRDCLCTGKKLAVLAFHHVILPYSTIPQVRSWLHKTVELKSGSHTPTFLPPSFMLLLTSQSYESSRIGLLGFGAGRRNVCFSGLLPFQNSKGCPYVQHAGDTEQPEQEMFHSPLRKKTNLFSLIYFIFQEIK